MNELQRQIEEDYPTVPGVLQRCDFCTTLKPPERLHAWPCGDFVMVTVTAGDTLYLGCECHAAAELPGGGQGSRQGYRGAWAACASCRRDIDANRWGDVTARSLRNVLTRTPVDRTILEGMHAMFRFHRSDGPWQPYSSEARERP